MADRLQQFIDRLDGVELEVAQLKRQMATMQTDIASQLETITVFITGANTVFGLARKHWKTAIVFGAGAMTSLGIGNPSFNAFLSGFFGA